jgi:hypothetical protein
VWVPLVVAGPLVRMPDRVVTKMVASSISSDFFRDRHDGEGAPHHDRRAADAAITSSQHQASVRKWGTQVGVNQQANGAINGPCQISGCTQIPVTKSVCEDNSGIWWGNSATGQ